MNYLTVKNLSKTFDETPLFENIAFTINKGQKVAFVAKNGAGKSTVLKCIFNEEEADSGDILFAKDIKMSFLSQDIKLNPNKSIDEELFDKNNPELQAIKGYENALKNPEDHEKMEEAQQKMEALNAWDYEVKVKIILTKLKIDHLEGKISKFSGGQKKRIAMAKALIDKPDLLVMDEPTNHLDLDIIAWLEEYLKRESITLLMVTHDRWFLERVCNEIIELDNGKIYRYKGNYSYFLDKKAAREAEEAKNLQSAKNLLKKELDWMRKQPQARETKSRARIEAFYKLQEKVDKKDIKEEKLKLEIKERHLGSKILEIYDLNKSFGDLKIVENFTYIFEKGKRIGVIGKNGVGKTTFLNLLTEKEKPVSGDIVRGSTVVFGFYRQEEVSFDEEKRIIEVVRDIADFIPLGKGREISAANMLTRFLFPPNVQYDRVKTLSGGEKRRLYLLCVLMKNPNFLILDEPTNDLDILTLNVLEDFLLDFKGCVIIVSHDRYFMDKLVDHILVFEGKGKIWNFPGNYSDYRDYLEIKEEHEKKVNEVKRGEKIEQKKEDLKKARKKTREEKKEMQRLEKQLEKLETEKLDLEKKLSHSQNMALALLQELTTGLGKLTDEIAMKEERWLELSELED